MAWFLHCDSKRFWKGIDNVTEAWYDSYVRQREDVNWQQRLRLYYRIYAAGAELTTFTALDGEDFYASR